MRQKIMQFLCDSPRFRNASPGERLRQLYEYNLEHVLSPQIRELDFYAYAEIASGALRQKAADDKLLCEMQRLQALFDAQGVPVLFMKGPLLGRLLYTPPYVRPTTDMDLLVPPERAEEAMDLLGGDGYRMQYDKTGRCGAFSGCDYLYNYFDGHPDVPFRKRHSLGLVKTDGDELLAELHIYPYRICAKADASLRAKIIGEVFRDAAARNNETAVFHVPGPADEFLLLCCHYTRHMAEDYFDLCKGKKPVYGHCLNHLHDLALYYEKKAAELDIRSLAERAAAHLCGIDLALSARALRDVYGLSVFDAFLRDFRDDGDADEENIVYNALYRHFTTFELVLCDIPSVCAKLCRVIGPLKRFVCSRLAHGETPFPDTEVGEAFSSPGRAPYRFAWGAGVRGEDLVLRMSLSNVGFLRGGESPGRADTVMRLSFHTGSCGAGYPCVCVLDISLFRSGCGLSATVTQNGGTSDFGCEAEEQNGEIILTLPLQRFAARSTLRFNIERRITLPRPHRPADDYTVSVPWADTVYYTHETCLCYGELVFPKPV